MVDDKTTKMSSVLGETSVVIGNVHGSGDLEIRGRVQGSVNLDGRLLISETGVVLGGVEATHIAVSGEVRGDLTAKDGVEVQAQGQVEGNIEAPRVGIEAGARVRGMLRTGGELPMPEAKEEEPAPVAEEPQPAPVVKEEPAPAPKQPKKARLRPKKSDRRAERQHEQHQATRDGKESKSPPPKSIGTEKDGHLSTSSSNRTSTSPTKDSERRPSHRKGPPSPPTFVKGARGRAKS